MNRFLGKYPPRYEAWLARAGSQHSRAAQVAFTAEEIHACDDSETRNYLYKYFMWLTNVGPEQRLELRSWRHPQLNLDLLQWALMLDDSCATSMVDVVRFILEEYSEDLSPGGELVNHPIHLACVFGRSAFLARISPSLIPWDEVGVIAVGDNRCLSRFLPPGRVSGKGTLRGTVLQLAAEFCRNCLIQLFDHALSMVLDRKMTPSSVLRLRNIVPTLADKGMAEDACKRLWRSSRVRALPEDALLLFGHFLCASEWKMTDKCDVTCLPFSTCLQRAQTCTIAVFLTKHQLCAFSRILERRVEADSDFLFVPGTCEHMAPVIFTRSVPLSWMKDLLTVLEKELRERTLLQESALTLIRNVRGDVRRLQQICMPKPLRQHFRVPFETCEKRGL